MCLLVSIKVLRFFNNANKSEIERQVDSCLKMSLLMVSFGTNMKDLVGLFVYDLWSVKKT